MLAEKELITACPADDDEADKPVAQNDEGAAAKRAPGGVPGDVRKLAKDAAHSHGMTLGDFLTEAIRAYAEQLDDEAVSGIDESPDAAAAIERCETRIAALEARVRALETAGKKDGFFARVRLENLVERPWLRNRGY